MDGRKRTPLELSTSPHLIMLLRDALNEPQPKIVVCFRIAGEHSNEDYASLDKCYLEGRQMLWRMHCSTVEKRDAKNSLC